MGVTTHKLAYWCAQWEVNGLLVEAGNADSMAELTVWISEHLSELPTGEGKFIHKRVGK